MKKILLLLLALIIILVGMYFVVDKRNNNQSSDTIRSEYGFTFTVPEGSHVWEGPSAAAALFSDEEIASEMLAIIQKQQRGEKLDEDSITKLKSYQDTMNAWKSESSRIIQFTTSETDFTDRSLGNAGTLSNTPLDSIEMINLKATDLIINTQPVKLDEVEINDENTEKRYVDIDGKKSLLYIIKSPYKVVNNVVIRYPLNSTQSIDSEKVSSLTFSRVVAKDDASAEEDLVSFISNLQIQE